MPQNDREQRYRVLTFLTFKDDDLASEEPLTVMSEASSHACTCSCACIWQPPMPRQASTHGVHAMFMRPPDRGSEAS
eukprot:3953033-Amphidinium_carterae.1